ncbi:MAG: hypothetical protein EA404_08835 [Spirochaetaceae bacterium]|nr:MAG: hypothetical protein EA404_08835 [Spirochaetaceae bacterium]
MRFGWIVLLVGMLLVLMSHSAAGAGGRESDSRRASKRFSYGFQDGEQCYFLLEYKVSTPRRPVWFIMPIERSPKMHYHRIFLYRFDTTTQELERLATVLETVPRQTTIQSTIFGLRDGRVVFAFNSGWDSERGLLHDLRVWDRDAGALVEAERVVAPRDAPEIARYFGDYQGGLANYPGMMTITTLRNEILTGVSEEQWDLPRP